MTFLLFLRSLCFLNAVVFGKKKRRGEGGETQTPPPPPHPPGSGKALPMSIDLLGGTSRCSALTVIGHFLAKQRAALQNCFGCLFWKAVPFMVRGYIFTN